MGRLSAWATLLAFLGFEATVIALGIVAIVSEYWLHPDGLALPFVARAGLWRLCLTGTPSQDSDVASASAFFSGIRESFQAIDDEDDAVNGRVGCTSDVGGFYADLWGFNGVARLNITRAFSLLFVYLGAVKTSAVLAEFFGGHNLTPYNARLARALGIFQCMCGWAAALVYMSIVVQARNNAPSWSSSDFMDYIGWAWWLFLATSVYAIFSNAFMLAVTIPLTDVGHDSLKAGLPVPAPAPPVVVAV